MTVILWAIAGQCTMLETWTAAASRTKVQRMQRRRRMVRRRLMAEPVVLRHVIEVAIQGVFRIDPLALAARCRGRAHTAHARQVAMYLAHTACCLSLTEVGLLFGRDRTTVAHACGVIEDARDDPDFDRVLDLLEQALPVMARRTNEG